MNSANVNLWLYVHFLLNEIDWNHTETYYMLELCSRELDTNGTFHKRMDTIKDRDAMDLTEAEDIKKRWQEYTEEIYKKILMTQITTMVWSLT